MTFLITFGKFTFPSINYLEGCLRISVGPIVFWWINEKFETIMLDIKNRLDK